MIEIVLLILALVLIISGIIWYVFDRRKSEISFRQGMDLTDLPIITLYQGNRKLNFLLDTGCNLCCINRSALEGLNYTVKESTTNVMGIEGNAVECPLYNISIYHNKTEYNYDFAVNNLDAAFGDLKKDTGVQLHGLLGSKFFEKYKYVLDFERLVAYSK